MVGAGPPHTAEHTEITMQSTDQPEPKGTLKPQPDTVIDEPATIEACAADYEQRSTGNPNGSFTATPHTQHRRN